MRQSQSQSRERTDATGFFLFRPVCATLTCRLLGWLVSLFVLNVYSPRLLADEPPTFVVEGETFSLQQVNLYKLGIFDEELSDQDIVEKMQKRDYELKEFYELQKNRHSYWMYIVDNRSGHSQNIFIDFSKRFPKTKAWIFEGNHLRPFDIVNTVSDVLSTRIPPGRSYIVAMRLSGGELNGKASIVNISDFNTFMQKAKIQQHVSAGVFGAVAIMILYNLGMLFFFRRMYFLYYAIYSAAALHALAILNSYRVWDLSELAIVLGIAGCALLQFCNSSLSLSTSHPRLYRGSQLFMVYSCLFAVYVWFTTSWAVIALSMPVVLAYSLFVSLKRGLQGYQPAVYMTLGWSIFLVTICLNVLSIQHPEFGYFSHMSLLGFVSELCFFSFAIGQKVRNAEQIALKEHKHAFNQLKKVFYPHQIEQIKAGRELEDTMPTGRGKACVINFDIIGSSKLPPSLAKSFIEASIKGCVSIINESYDAETLQSTGYRIKEVGDGFLCSVGYPFKTPNETDAVELSLDLALRFVSIFQSHVDALQNQYPVYCSIGVARDYLEGYFPKVGTIEYDVFGRAIILATRYQSFRKQLFPNTVPGHIITVHERIFDRLPISLQQIFTKLDLRKEHMSIRDDLNANVVYYRIISGAEASGKPQLAI
jgi:class 3 adenylate cyclase